MATKALTTYEKELNKLPATLLIKDSKGMEQASEARAKLKTIEKAMEEEKQKVLKPLNAARKAELDRWRPMENKVEAALSVLDKEMTRYQTEQSRIADEKQAKIAARIGEGRGKISLETATEKMNDIDTPAAEVATASGATGFRDHPCFEVMDITILPMEYHLADEARIRELMKVGTELPGVRYWVEKRPVNR